LIQTSGFLLCIVLGCGGAFAQVDSGSVAGIVRNPAGDGAAGAKVFLKNDATAITKSTYARGDGTYIFAPVKIGTYTVSVELQGFVPAFQAGVVVEIQHQASVNFRLVASQAANGASVSSGSTASYTHEPADKLASPSAVDTLPVFSRNVTNLAQLFAGTGPTAQLVPETSTPAQLLPGKGPIAEVPANLAATGSFVANGVQSAQNNYILDGADNNNRFLDFLPSTAYQVLPAMDAIDEFRVQTMFGAALGGAAGAVINATTKAGTNEFHGSAWDYFSNDYTSAADYFDNAVALRKSELRKNQYGATLGGPLNIPNFYNGKNRTFFFADYQGTKYRQGVPFVGTVPTLAERGSGYTDFSDLISGQPKCTTGPDVLGRTVACGTIFDPATTRLLATGQVDPISGLRASATGYVRDPIQCKTVANTICANRVDAVTAGLLNLYPAPTIATIYNNYTTNEFSRGDANQFDVRVDHHLNDRNQTFVRFSYLNNPQLQYGPFNGYADGGGYTQTDTAVNGVISLNHVSSPTLIHNIRLAASYVELERVQAYANYLTDLPAQFGISGVPQFTGNGGLPTIDVGIYSPLGSTPYTPAIDYNATYQFSEGFTKTLRNHTIIGGGEVMQVKNAVNQPPYSRGEFGFSGNFTSIANSLDPSTGAAQFVLTPQNTTVPFGRNGVGGPNRVDASNISTIDNYNWRLYYAAYLQDEWKYRPDLTFTIGGRWEYFQPWKENFSAEANFVPGSSGQAQYLIPAGRGFDTLPCGALYPVTCTSTYINSLSTDFTSTLTNDSITLNYPHRGGIVNTQRTNIGPRIGFAYQYTPKIVVRGGYGLFYGGMMNEGSQANLSGGYPFQVNYQYTSLDDGTPIAYPSTLANATLEQGLAPIPLTPLAATATDLVLRGIQRTFKNPYTNNFNLSVQDRRSNNDLLQFTWVTTVGHHLLINPGTNEVGELLPPFEQAQAYEPYLSFAYGTSYLETEGDSKYNAGQLQYVRNLGHGLSFLANYTYSTTRTDALDFFNLNGLQTYRAPSIQSIGIRRDYQQADFAVRHLAHFSGGYDLPFGPGRQFLAQKGNVMGKIAGNWSLNWIFTYASGQPLTIPCTLTTAAGVGCDALLVQGAHQSGGPHNANQYWNPASFYNPPLVASTGQGNTAPLGGGPAQVYGPNLIRLDAALRRSVQIRENVRVEFRAEAYNVLNHPFFAQPTNLDFLNLANFGQINSTRDNPNDARAIQFAVKFYF
jgi:carboxypeptidase family protein